MALIDGSDLGRVLRSGGPLTPDRAVHVMGQAARALDTAHRHGLVHRDVKPANLLVLTDRDDFTYLVDFGIAYALDSGGTSLTGTGATVGTLAYMAPEGRRVDARTDVYALTCVLFEMLTGRLPFPADSTTAMMLAHLRTAPPRVTDVRPDLPREWDDVIALGMEKDLSARPSSPGDLYEMARMVPRRWSRASVDSGRAPAGAGPAPAVPRQRPGGPIRIDPAVPRPRRAPVALILTAVLVAAVAVVTAVIVLPMTGNGGTATRSVPAPTSVATAPSAQLPSTESTTTFRTVREPGWGYAIDVPQALPDQQGSGDDVLFTGTGAPAELRVTARVRPSGDTSSLLAAALAEATAGGGRTTYSNDDADSYTGSGLDASGTIFYFHAVMSDGAIVTATWTYPVSDKARWDTAVTRSAKSLRIS